MRVEVDAMKLSLRRRRPRDSHAEAVETIREARAWRDALNRWRPLRGSEKARAELDHAARRFYGDGS
jgi:hypothetical protein